jgi:hypothetical protein
MESASEASKREFQPISQVGHPRGQRQMSALLQHLVAGGVIDFNRCGDEMPIVLAGSRTVPAETCRRQSRR